MATFTQVQQALKALIDAAIAGRNDVVTEIGEPSRQQLTQVACKNIIAIRNHMPAKNSTRWMPSVVQEVLNATGVISTLNKTTLPVGGVATLTLSGTLAHRDAVSLVVTNPQWLPAELTRQRHINGDAAVGVAVVPSDTLTTLAGKLITEAGTRPNLLNWITLSQSGPVITITNISGRQIKLESFCGNVADRYVQGTREMATVLISLYATTPQIRNAIGDLIRPVLTRAHANFGLTLANTPAAGSQEYVRLMVVGDLELYDDTDKGVWRRDFSVSLDYGLNYVDLAYSILAALRTETIV